DHDGRRHPGGASGPALGYVLRGSRSVYFAGDTDLFAGMAALAPLDVALLPVAGWGKKLGPGHLDPQRAAAALALLRPRIAVPRRPTVRERVGPGRGVRAGRRSARPGGPGRDPPRRWNARSRLTYDASRPRQIPGERTRMLATEFLTFLWSLIVIFFMVVYF